MQFQININQVLITIILLCVATYFTSNLNAQSEIGVQFIASNNSLRYIIDYNDEQPTSAMTGYGFGLFYTQTLTPGLSITPSVSYRSSGFRLDRIDEAVNMMVALISKNEVQTSFIAKINSPSGFMRPFMEIGPSISYHLNRSEEKISDNEDLSFQLDELTKINTHIIVGAGFDMDMGQSTLSIFVRYEMGLGNDYTGSQQGIIIRTNALSFGARLGLLSFGKKKATNCTKGKCF